MSEVLRTREVLPERLAGAVSEDAIRHLMNRSPLNRAIYEAIRKHDMTNMSDADDPSWAFPLVDLMSNEPPADIGTGELEMVYLADEIEAAVLASSAAGQREGWNAARIAEMINEGGSWRACSGCQEGDDGHVSARDYPYSEVFRCQPGGGCTECGGIGVIWEGPGYWDGYAEQAIASPSAPEERRDEVEVQFEVWQDGMMVAASTDEADAWHYLAVYSQDGPATLMRAETLRAALTPVPGER